ncbi:hypothetical protein AEB_P0861 [Altererythrobacter sp. B11]|nr:hypothetical protein AEB_P0861 [Altererythrobacter sp. B11]
MTPGEILRQRADRFPEIDLPCFHDGLSIKRNDLADHPRAANAGTRDDYGVSFILALRGFRVVGCGAGLFARLCTKRCGKYDESRAREEGWQPP